MNNQQKPISPAVVGLTPKAELDTPMGRLYQIDTYDYTGLAEEVSSRAVADSGYYSLAGGMNECSLTKSFSDVIDNNSVPAPLSTIMPVVSDGDWFNSVNFPVREQIDLISAFQPVCCGAGEGSSVTSALSNKTFHNATFAVSWQLCIPEVMKARTSKRFSNPEAAIMADIAEIISYGSSYVALHGGFGIEGLLNNGMVGSFFSPAPLMQLNGRDLMKVVAAAIASLDPNNFPDEGYTLYLPTRIMRYLGLTPYSDMHTGKLLQMISGGCACPDGMEIIPGMITRVRGLELLKGAAPGVGSGDMALILPTEDSTSTAAGKAAYWYRPVPMMPLEQQQIGLSRYGTVLVHTGDVITMRPRQMLKLYNV